MVDVRPIVSLDRPVHAVVRPPGSKSLTNRALVCAAMAEGGVSRIVGALESDDTLAMRSGLRNLGVAVDDNDDPWLVLGTGGSVGSGTVDARSSGTTARFLTAVAALTSGSVTIDGSRRLRERPIQPLIEALRAIGADIMGDRLPVTARSAALAGGNVEIDGSESSQFVTAMLMLAPLLPHGAQVEVTGDLVSSSYVVGTLHVMQAFGADISGRDCGYVVQPGGYRKSEFEVEADASAAAYPLVAAAITGGTVTIDGLSALSTQPDIRLVDVLESMGCDIQRDHRRVTLTGPPAPLRPVDADMRDAPDASLALAVACLFAEGSSRLSGLSTLRVKETDRLSALVNEIRRLGAGAAVEGDSLLIEPKPLASTTIETYDDHRMAMAFAVAGLRVKGLQIRDPGCVAKTWPNFFKMLDSL